MMRWGVRGGSLWSTLCWIKDDVVLVARLLVPQGGGSDFTGLAHKKGPSTWSSSGGRQKWMDDAFEDWVTSHGGVQLFCAFCLHEGQILFHLYRAHLGRDAL